MVCLKKMYYAQEEEYVPREVPHPLYLPSSLYCLTSGAPGRAND